MLLRSLIQAFSTYSAIPAPETKWDEDSMKYALAFFPLVGAVIGAAEYGAYLLLVYLNSGALLTAAVLTALPLFLTGGIHMDGFLDACDALHSWRDREEKLRIMKDPHAGAFAVISCGIYLILYLGGASEAGLLEMRVFCASFGLTRALSAAAALTIPKARTGGMLRAVRAIAAADYVFLDDNEPLLDYLIPDKRTVLTQLWHAGVGFKSSGYSRWGCQGAPAPFSCHRQYTWGIVSSKAVIPIFSEIWGINDDQVLPLGIPRIDRFLDPGHRAEAERIAEERYPLIRGKRVILFAPTYRGKGKTDASYPYERIDFDLLYETAGEDSVVLFHMHPWTRERVPIPERMKDRMADTADTADINDLFYVTDVLITDYSSNICEFSLMGKPMLFYGFDEREYAAERGFHRDYETFAPGKVCRTFAELAEALRTGDFEQEKQERYVREQFERRDCGASDRVIDRILLGR